MKAAIFQKFCDLVYRESGIFLKEGKESLLEARIGKRKRALGLASDEDYFEQVISDKSGQELVQLLDVISTNVTHFFRDPNQFEFLEDLISNWIDDDLRTLRIWSAASSSGEEPFSIAMILAKVIGSHKVDWKILGTDISTRMLAVAKLGEFEDVKIDGKIDRSLIAKYLLKRNVANGRQIYCVADELKSHCKFARLNLIEPPYPMRGPFDIIFCRNVMIYFDEKTRRLVVESMLNLLKPGGYLFVGSAESLVGMQTRLVPVRPAIYCNE